MNSSAILDTDLQVPVEPVVMEVGKPCPQLAFGEGVAIGFDRSGISVIFSFSNPTKEEIKAVSSDSDFEIRSMVRDGCLWIFLKCGSMPWAEAPYLPYQDISRYLDPIEDDSSGYALMLYMVDADDTTIKHMRLVGLGNQFSKKLRADIEELVRTPFVEIERIDAVAAMQANYTPGQMARMCGNYYRLKT